MRKDFEFLPRIEGTGRFLGVNVGVIADTDRYARSWWGEGEVKIYLDGDLDYPTLCGTGAEDYIGTAWGQGQYAHLYQGCHIADDENSQYAFYRYHVIDPIYFYRDIRVTMQQIGCWGPDHIKQMCTAGQQLQRTVDGQLVAVDMVEAARAAGYGMFEREDDWSSCAYFYLDSPVNRLPPLAPLDMRVGDLLESDGPCDRVDA